MGVIQQKRRYCGLPNTEKKNNCLRFRLQSLIHPDRSRRGPSYKPILVALLSFACFCLVGAGLIPKNNGATAASRRTFPFYSDSRLVSTGPNVSGPAAIRQASAGMSKLEGCVSCHTKIEPMHKYGATETLEQIKGDKDAVGLTCTACHGGNPGPRKTSDDSKEIERIKRAAHVQPRFPNEWKRDGKRTVANPERTNTLLERESWEFVRFINPGDNRVASKTCSGSQCHDSESRSVARSMMSHGAMLWGAALYNNGGFPLQDVRFGGSYHQTGAPRRLLQTPAPTADEQRGTGVLEFLDPIPRWEISQPGNVLH